MAGVYTHGHHASVLRSHEWRTAENSAAYLLPYLHEGQSLLDVGCGPGTITADLVQRVGRVVAIDASDGILAQARAVADARGLDTVDFRVGDAHALEFEDASFDVVHAHQVLQHVADPVQSLREMRRVCRPAGVVAARDSDYAAMTWFPAVPELDEWLALYRQVARHNGGEPDAGRRLLAWAHAAGFADVAASAGTWCYADAESRRWWSGIWAERMVASAIAEQAQRYGYATRADLERIAAGWRVWGGAADGWFTVLHGQIVARP
jgi:ubiquinone/menaquinone biosynthesis C-methylase UbiE